MTRKVETKHTYTCDRCGGVGTHLTSWGTIGSAKLEAAGGTIDLIKYPSDLCPSCITAFDAWWHFEHLQRRPSEGSK